MRRFAVAAVLLVCLVAAVGAQPSFPRRKTGAPSCTQPITGMQCFLDATSGYVMGIRYNYTGQAAPTRVCGASTGTTTARGSTQPANSRNAVITSNRGDTTVTQTLNFQTDFPNLRVGIIALDVMKFPGTKARGSIPAIKVYLGDMITGAPGGFVVCGNQNLMDLANLENPNGALEVATRIVSPVVPSEDDPREFTTFLSSFVGKCAKRNLVNNPNDPTFFLQQIQKPCWADLPASQFDAADEQETPFDPPLPLP